MSDGDDTTMTIKAGGRTVVTTVGELGRLAGKMKNMSASQPSLDGKFATIVNITMALNYSPDGDGGKPTKLEVGDIISVSGTVEVVKEGDMRTEFGPRPFAVGKGLDGKVRFVSHKEA